MNKTPIIRLANVEKSFMLSHERLPILHMPNWTVDTGEQVALLGPSGCGKSTVLHLLSGILRADAGEVTVCGQPLHKMSEGERDRFRSASIGYIMQDFHLIHSLTAVQNVELVMQGAPDKRERRRLLAQWFDRTGLADRMHHLPGQLSRGQQQRVAMIRALVNRPKLVLADEPTGSLDFETAGAVMSLLLQLCQDEGLTLLTVTHDLHLAELYPSRVQMNELNAAIRYPAGQTVQRVRAEGVQA